ncbi:hypothetical protein B0H21DRAFT_397885 [Amylocystis lapponica]|nr:hypothetical protein B0H21DRAFT_397885 [Amylocystis lapponica]
MFFALSTFSGWLEVVVFVLSADSRLPCPVRSAHGLSTYPHFGCATATVPFSIVLRYEPFCYAIAMSYESHPGQLIRGFAWDGEVQSSYLTILAVSPQHHSQAGINK